MHGLRRPWDAIAWWEIRRIPFNLVLLFAGVLSIVVAEFVGGRLLPPGEDLEEPLGLIAGVILYAIAANVCYSLGWITELIWTWGNTQRTETMRPKVFLAGLVFSTVLTLAPAAIALLIWAGSGFH